MTPWRTIRDAAAKLRSDGHRRRVARPGPLQRLDPVLGAVLFGAVVGLAGLGWSMAAVERTRGLFDPAVVAPVPDLRILSDFRAADAPFADGVMQRDDAYLGRTDGTILRYDTATELFATEALPRDGQLTGDLTLLSQGCGDRPEAGLPPCPVAATLFAVTDRGGLAARNGGRWRVLLGDAGWTAPDGSPVAQADLVAWAVSDDGRWMLASAGAKGLGLFDQQAGAWSAMPAPGGAAAAPNRVLFAAGAFWLGGPAGLERLVPSASPVRKAVAGGEGDIYDLDLAADGGLLALRRGGCPEGCLSILSVSPRGALSVLAGETALSAGLSQARLDHAAMQAGRLVVLGEAGVHVYDPARRNWQALETRPVDAWHASTDGAVIYFAAAGRFAKLQDATPRDERVLSVPLTQVLPIAGGQVLGLNRDGAVLDLTPDVPVMVGFADPGLPVGARFVAGAEVGGTLVLLGPQGVLLHDTVARRYAFQDAASLPPALLAARAVRLLAAGAQLWAVDMSSGQVFLGTLGGDWPGRQVVFAVHAMLGGPLRSAQAQGDTLDLVTQDGAPFRVLAGDPGVVQPLTGAGLAQPLTPASMAATARDLIFSTGSVIWHYDLAARGWDGPGAGPQGQTSDLAVGQHLYALTTSGALYQAGEQAWEPVSGAGPGASLARRDVTDALATPGQMFLGGDGGVLAYAPALRRFTGAWTGGRGDVRLVAVQGGVPLWSSGARLWFGDAVVSGDGETVLGAWQAPDGPVYLAQQDGRLHAVGLGTGRACLFRGSAAPGGDLVDARNLPDGRLFVLTTEAAVIYEPALHRWTALSDNAAGPATRLEVIGDHLLRLDAGRLRTIPLADLPTQDSCAAGRLDVGWQVDVPALGLAPDATTGTVQLLTRDGAVREWQGGRMRPVLAAPNAAPDPATLRRVYPGTGEVTFAAGAALWRYDLGSRLWTDLPYQDAPPQVAEVDVVSGPTGPVVTIWDPAGAAWGAEGATALRFAALALPPLPRLTVPPETLIDMAANAGVVAVLGRRMLEVFDDRSMAARGRIALPAAQQGWSLGRAAGAAQMVLVDGDPAAPVALHVLDARAIKGDMALDVAGWRYAPGTDLDWALAEDDVLWRIDADLVLWRCIGGAPIGCTVIAAAPLAMTADAIRAVADAGDGGSYLLQPDRLLHLGAEARLLATVAGPTVGPGTRLFTAGAEVLLWEGPDRSLWRIAQGQAALLLPVVQAVQRTSGGVASTTPDGLRLRKGGAFVQTAATDSRLTALSLARNGRVFGLAGDGRIWQRGAAGPEDPLLQVPVDSLAVHPGQLILDNALHPGWWSVAASGAVRFDWMSRCAVPLPPPLLAYDGVAVGGVDAGKGRANRVLPRSDTVPCAKTRTSSLRLPAGQQLLQIAGTPTAPVLVTTAGEITLDAALAEVSRAPLRRLLADTHQAIGDLARMQARVAVVQGTAWLAPPVIANATPGQLVIGGPVPDQNSAGSMVLHPWDAFDLDWLGWDRAARQFRFGSTGTAPRLAPERAIVDGLFLPAHPGRAAYLGQGRFAWLNPHGLWHVAGGTGIEPVLIQPFPAATGLAHGRFLVPGRGVDAATGLESADADRFDAALGALAFAERLRGGGVTATLAVSGQPVPAFGPRGFLFDTRAAIGAAAGQAVMLTPLGLVPATTLQGAFAAPRGTDRLGQQGDRLFAGQPGGWHALAPDGRWQGAPAPDRSRALAQESGRQWQRVAGRAQVVPLVAAEGWRVAGRGLAFDADRLVAMTADAEGVVLVTGSGTQAAPGLAGAAALTAALAPDPGVVSLDAQAVGAGQSVVWANIGGGRLVWDRAARQWTAPQVGRRPWEDRRAAVLGPITLAFRQGVAAATVTVTGLDGVPRDAAFDWARGATMPFDRVRAVHAEAGRLLLGTDFGLRRLDEQAGLATSDALFATGSGPPDAVLRLGRPDAAPARLLAETGPGGCLEMASAAAAPQACADAGGLATRRVVQSDLWRWTKGDGAVAGQYLLSDGSAVDVPLPMRGGLPHDVLRDRVRCAGIEAELWGGHPVSTVLQGGVPVRLDPAAGIDALQCQLSRAELGQGQALPAGLHGLGAAAALATAAGWQPEGAAQAQGLAQRASGGLPWDAARLRIRLDAGAALAEYRGQDDIWHPLPWASGRLPVDTPLALAAAQGGVQAFTAAGFAGLTQRAGLRVDPSALLLATPGDRLGFAGCIPDRVEMWDGSVQAAPVRPGGPVALRCADGRVFLGQPGGPADQGAFTALSDDPFVARTLVDVPGFWTWAREGAVPGQRGSLVISFKGEPVGLNAGRLTIDAYSAIAAPFSDTIELASPDGWWRQPDDDIGLQVATRGPGRPADVTGLSSDRNRDGTRLLCLTAATRQIMAADGPLRRTEDCRDWTGQDAVWVWQQTGAGPTATAIPLNGGEMTRLLEAGQFADLIVTGAPTALPSGEIVAPTRLGATVIGAQGAQGVYARDRGGALLRSSTGVPLLVDAGGVLALGEAGPLGCPAVQELAARLPDGVAIRRIELRDRRAATLTVQAADGRRQIRLPCADIGKALYWAEVMDVSDRPRLLANAAEWPDRAGQLVVAVTAQGFDLGSGGGRGVSVPGLPEGPALALFSGQNGRATFLLSERDFTRVDTDHAISLVAQQAGPLAPLAGPFPAAAAVAAPQEAAQPQPPVQPAPPVQPQPPVQPAPDPAPPTAQSAVPPDSSPLRVLTKEDARAVQAALRALGRYDGAIDGAVGPVTRAALRQWQRDQRLAPTGALTQNQFVALLGGGGP